VTVLEMAEDSSGRIVLCARLSPGEEFVLRFTHSVNQRPVFETLRADDDHLVIVKSRFDSFGAGMPDISNGGGTLALREDGWLEWTVNRRVPEVTVRVGRTANHTLHLKGGTVPLARLAEPGSALSLRACRISAFSAMKRDFLR
jgi:hypothetical protein